MAIENREAVLSMLESESQLLLQEDPDSHKMYAISQKLHDLRTVLVGLKEDLQGPAGIIESAAQSQQAKADFESVKESLDETEMVLADGISKSASSGRLHEKMMHVSELKTLCEAEEAKIASVEEQQPIEESFLEEDVVDVKSRLERVKSTVDDWEQQLCSVEQKSGDVSSRLDDIASETETIESFLESNPLECDSSNPEFLKRHIDALKVTIPF